MCCCEGVFRTVEHSQAHSFGTPKDLPFPGGVLTPAVACGEALARRLISSRSDAVRRGLEFIFEGLGLKMVFMVWSRAQK